MQHLMLHAARTLVRSCASSAAASRRRRALAIVTALAPQWLVCGRRGRRAAAVAVVDVVFHVFVELLEEEGALEAHLLDAAVEAQDALARAVVGFFDVVDAAPEIDAFAVVGGFDGRRQVFLRVGAGCWGWVSINRGVDGCGARC